MAPVPAPVPQNNFGSTGSGSASLLFIFLQIKKSIFGSLFSNEMSRTVLHYVNVRPFLLVHVPVVP